MAIGQMKAGLGATESPTLSDIMWLTGLWEGEGAVSRPPYPHLNITQKDPWILERCKALFGGTVSTQGKFWQWGTSGPRARGLIMTMLGTNRLSPRRRAQLKAVL